MLSADEYSGIAFSSPGARLHPELLCSRRSESVPWNPAGFVSPFFLAPCGVVGRRGGVWESCLLMIISLHRSYWKLISRIGRKRLVRTQALGWMARLGYFLRTPLTQGEARSGAPFPAAFIA